MRASVAIVATYVIGSAGLEDLWTRFSHFHHLVDTPVWVDAVVLVGVFPFVLGVACVQMTRPSGVRWTIPIGVAPFLALGARLWLDDVSAQWVTASAVGACLATLVAAACAVAGGVANARRLRVRGA